jgi:hypothetical protein
MRILPAMMRDTSVLDDLRSTWCPPIVSARRVVSSSSAPDQHRAHSKIGDSGAQPCETVPRKTSFARFATRSWLGCWDHGRRPKIPSAIRCPQTEQFDRPAGLPGYAHRSTPMTHLFAGAERPPTGRPSGECTGSRPHATPSQMRPGLSRCACGSGRGCAGGPPYSSQRGPH